MHLSEFSVLREKAGLSIPDAAALTGYAERTVFRWENGETSPRRVVIDLLQERVRRADRTAGAFTFIDLFAGIGGLRRGFEHTGGRCVFTSEWNAYSQKTYRANFADDHDIAGDIRDVQDGQIPDHDLLLAGFPCQPFSLAGVSKKNSLGREHGFLCEAQGTLFFDLARIIARRRPRAFVLENVRNLVSHDRGQTFRVIKEALRDELGYELHTRIVNARSYVPQHRERIFIVGFRDPSAFSFDDLVVPAASDGPRLGSILHPEDGSEPPEAPFTDPDGKVSARYTLSPHLWSYLQGYAAKHREKGNGFGFGLVGPEDVARTLSARYHKDGSEILVRRADGPPRRLTPRECARLMGFDTPGGSDFRIPVSDTQAYRQFGNAVVVPVVEAVARLVAAQLGPVMAVTGDAPLAMRQCA